MDEFYKDVYGAAWADVYDQWRDAPDIAHMVEVLYDLSGGGSALELGVGTGRIALPLANSGAAVTGIDLSPQMLARLRDKDVDRRVTTLTADMSSFELPERFDLIYIVQHSFYCLPDQESQQACLRACVNHMKQEGRLVIEGSVYHPGSWTNDQVIKVVGIDDTSVTLRLGVIDPVTQRAITQHVTLSADGISMRPLRLRYCSVDELDAMADTAGLSLISRHGGWNEEPFTEAYGKSVSVYAAH